LSGRHGPVANAQQRQVARETRRPNLSVHPALLGAALVSFLFRKNDDEEKLLTQYHAEDTLPNNSGERTADQISSKEGRDDGSV
jgi:recombinational DNA repair protein (RecF pathway)